MPDSGQVKPAGRFLLRNPDRCVRSVLEDAAPPELARFSFADPPDEILSILMSKCKERGFRVKQQ
jgi:hypothetical protein